MKQKAHLIANSKSGKGKGSTLQQEALKLCAEYDYELIAYPVEKPSDLAKQSEFAVQAALKDGGVVIAAGGDGTIRGVAQAAYDKSIRFAVVPCGTFNFFARTHRVPEDLTEALRLALTGEVRPVRLGRVNEQVFLINASLGLYAKAIREREARTSRYGRNRLVVIFSTIASLLSEHSVLRVELKQKSEMQTLRTPLIFIGNNALQLRDLKMDVVSCMKQDLMAVVMMKPLNWLEKLRIIFRGFFKTLEKDERLETFCVEDLNIHTQQRRLTVALDGEIFHMRTPLRVETLPKILNMVLPPKQDPLAAPGQANGAKA